VLFSYMHTCCCCCCCAGNSATANMFFI
jgi:hypothetical protein